MKNYTVFQPLGDRVLVQPDAEETKQGDIIIPEVAVERPVTAQVLARGTGTNIPPELRYPVKVLVSKYGGTDVMVNDKPCRLMHVDDILAVLG